MHPAEGKRLDQLWDDVGGLDLDDSEVSRLLAPDLDQLPRYVTTLENGSRRVLLFEGDYVALPLFKILRLVDDIYQPRFSSEQKLREAYKISDHTQIIAIGVGIDKWIERFWREHLNGTVLPRLAHMGISAVTVPNFSFFEDSTRFQHLRNRKRILLVAERLSKAGVHPIVHLNAHNKTDWKFWADFLRKHPEIKFVSKEFQTGLSDITLGEEAVENLAKLEQEIGRPLHPLLIGGGKFYQKAQSHFGNRFTVIDSRPFRLAMARQVLCYSERGIPMGKNVPTEKGQGIDHLLHETLLHYPSILREGVPRKSAEKNDICQEPLNLTSERSKPNLTPQPVAPGMPAKYFGTTKASHSSRGRQRSSW